ncbi:MAG: LemA family protein [bacterium]|nr:LemA family protein [bacterium]
MKYVLFLLLFIAAMLAVFFSFSATYMACADAETRVRHARVQLVQEVMNLAQLLPSVAALYYRFGTNGPYIVTYAEQARTQLEQQHSPLGMARAHAALQSALQSMAAEISAHPRARSHLKYRDVMTALNDTTQRIAYLQLQYNSAVADFNQLLASPQPAFWRSMMGMTNAEPFLAPTSATSASPTHQRQPRAAR